MGERRPVNGSSCRRGPQGAGLAMQRRPASIQLALLVDVSVCSCKPATRSCKVGTTQRIHRACAASNGVGMPWASLHLSTNRYQVPTPEPAACFPQCYPFGTLQVPSPAELHQQRSSLGHAYAGLQPGECPKCPRLTTVIPSFFPTANSHALRASPSRPF